MIKSEINVYERTAKRKNKETYTIKQYVIRLKSKNIPIEILEKLNDKDPVFIFTYEEYNDLEEKVNDLINEKESLEKVINEQSIKHIQELKELNKVIASKQETIDTLHKDYNRLQANKRHTDERLNKALLKINELENTWINKLFSRFRKKKELNEGKEN